jgi:hypothetical protein
MTGPEDVFVIGVKMIVVRTVGSVALVLVTGSTVWVGTVVVVDDVLVG